jgi:hypothetical protein
MAWGNSVASLVLVALLMAVVAASARSSDSSSDSSSGSSSGMAAVAAQASSQTYPSLVLGNSDMGIQSYVFPVALSEDIVISGVSFKHSELRVYLRLFCSEGGISIKGFGGLFPSNPAFPAASYFYKQPSELQSLLRLSVSSSSSSENTGRSWPLWWKDTVTDKSDMGFWPVNGPSNVTADSLSLRLKGSSMQHRLQLPACSTNAGSTTSSSLLSTPSSHISSVQQHDRAISGIWNVVTTTDPNLIPAEKMARLLLLHSRYHQRLGFQGTILRCNQDEAHVLDAIPQLKTEILAEKLIIWPWVWVSEPM